MNTETKTQLAIINGKRSNVSHVRIGWQAREKGGPLHEIHFRYLGARRDIPKTEMEISLTPAQARSIVAQLSAQLC